MRQTSATASAGASTRSASQPGAGGSARPRRSRERLVAAVTALVDERDPSEVSVTDVVRRAGLTRPTFYSSFTDLPTALAAAALARLEDAFAVAPPGTRSQQADAEGLRSVLTEILGRLAPHAPFFVRVLRGPGGLAVQAAVVDYLAQRLRTSSPVSRSLACGPLPLQVTTEAVAAGLAWTMLGWLEDPRQRGAEEMASLLCDLVVLMTSPGLGGGSLGGPAAPAAEGAARGGDSW